jgi:hypothetical protein
VKSPSAYSTGRQYQDGAAFRTFPARRTMPGRCLTRALEDNNLHRRFAERRARCSFVLDGPMDGDAFRAYVVTTVLDVQTRVSDLYSYPFDQIQEQLRRLLVERVKERQEGELINNAEYGLLSAAWNPGKASANRDGSAITG